MHIEIQNAELRNQDFQELILRRENDLKSVKNKRESAVSDLEKQLRITTTSHIKNLEKIQEQDELLEPKIVIIKNLKKILNNLVKSARCESEVEGVEENKVALGQRLSSLSLSESYGDKEKNLEKVENVQSPKNNFSNTNTNTNNFLSFNSSISEEKPEDVVSTNSKDEKEKEKQENNSNKELKFENFSEEAGSEREIQENDLEDFLNFKKFDPIKALTEIESSKFK